MGASRAERRFGRTISYRIDFVVEGRTRRVAVECDGDRFHPIEKIAEDMARQAVLERIGWRFIRIRGSQFFRDPNAAMQSVFEALAEMGIEPDAQSTLVERSSSSNQLLDGIKRRAAEILLSFDADSSRTRRDTYAAGFTGSA